MHEIELALGLLVAVAALATLARRIGVPYPIVLVLGGLALGLVPGLPSIELDPEIVFLIFLPPLLYQAAVFTSLRDFKANLQPIALLSVGLVVFTTLVVGVVAHLAIEGLPWAAAFALGAIVAPPDAVAATAIVQRLGVPRRIVTILEGESLVNDATALVAYRFAVAAAVTGAFSIWEAGIGFVVVALGGIAIGLAAGWLVSQLRRRLDDPPVEITISILTPFAAYLPAEALHVSGVLAAVSCGLYVGWHLPHLTTSEMRIQAQAVWRMLVFLLNGFIFILIGLQLPSIVSELTQPLPTLLWYAGLVSLTVILARIVWVFAATYVPHGLNHDTHDGHTHPGWQNVSIVAWTGMRGVVSLAAALALPFSTLSGEPFPGRQMILFLTFTVILATLVLQGLCLPPIIRWLGVASDGSHEREEVRARAEATEAALERIRELAAEWPSHRELVDQLESQYQHRERHAPSAEAERTEEEDQELHEHRLIRQAVLDAEREALLELRGRGVISDEVLHRVERDLDLDELRLEA